MRRAPYRLAALLLAGATAGAAAQVPAPDDPWAGDPTGIVADPCPAHPKPRDGAEWQRWNRHMLARDWGQHCRYAADNAALKAAGTPVQVVFMGDSITDNWINLDPGMFQGGLVDRGISGQTTPQMLVRFRADVIDLHPQAVHIMAGTNDIAGNTGATTLARVQGQIATMAELARAHGIKVILGAIPPAASFAWARDKQPVAPIRAMNAWLRDYARANGHAFVDYHAAMATPEGAMKPGLSSDGVHPTAAGYAVMRPLALDAIRRTLGGASRP
ncbi:lysophospholipase L1-like esterase [Sphingomonas sp. BE138]|uniref:SGNH/GDSL hydrolase family protein n=1 Tax=Sphingomonas sp. BE138 TaxID=2817845 RepID=UPI00285F41D1|nr:SGNH/GDSL hydrolase family protein [Sphingomonas sp. BE138]MDR6787050.1 lysophospholipase L1-like esterase [Sphingomonas sp. BE138]